MKIALYYPWIYLTSGAERTILELSGRSRHSWTLFTSHYEPQQTFPGFADREVVRLDPVSVERSMRVTLRSAWTISRQRLPLEEYDVLVVVCEGLGDLVVFRNRSLPVVCICLTPLRIAFDTHYRDRYREGLSPWHARLLDLGAGVFRWVDRAAWTRYDKVFFISQESQRRARGGRLGEPSRQEVLHVGLGFEPSTPSRSFDRFFLIPGRIMWTKNIELGIRAFREFRSSRPEFQDFRLVVAGIVDAKSQDYLSELTALAGGDTAIRFTVFPTDEELADLYRTCHGVLFTPFNEDWGIVPLEAMAFGKPVVAVKRGGPLETVVHGEHGFLEEPESARFAARMTELASNPELARAMGQAGHLHSRQFSWRHFTDRIDREIDRLVLRRQGRPRAVDEKIRFGPASEAGEMRGGSR